MVGFDLLSVAVVGGCVVKIFKVFFKFLRILFSMIIIISNFYCT